MDMNGFFEKYIRGTDELPYDQAFAAIGMRLLKSPAGSAYTGGIVIDQQDRQGLRLGALRGDSPGRAWWLTTGRHTGFNWQLGMPVARDNWSATLSRFKQGDRVPITVRRYRQTLDLFVQLDGPDVYNYRIEEDPNASAQSKTLRAAWLKGK